MNYQKAASVLASGTPDAAQLAKINAYTKSPLTAEQVYYFSVRLCDDLPDRDFERFDTAALPVLAELFRGKTGIVDHEWSADRQIARIFDTEVCSEAGVSFIRAHCYMLRLPENDGIIAQIEGGIRKEVSVGCAMERIVCSVCGEPYGACVHHKGVDYGGSTCVAVLSDPTDAYEFSFVAVPAQRNAGVLKAVKGGECMTLQELVQKSGTPALHEALSALEKEAAFGREQQTELLRKTVALGLLLDFGASEELLQKAFGALSGKELSELNTAMQQKAASLFPPQTQLPSASCKPAALEAAYII